MPVADGEAFRIEIGPSLTVRSVNPVRDTLVNALSEHNDVHLYLDPDVEFDVCGIQLLESARLYARSQGKTLALATPADAPLRQVLTRGGFLDQPVPDFTEFWLHHAAEDQ